MTSSMTPIPIPPEAAATRPHLKALSIGPPPGVSDAECGTVESLVGMQDGYPVYADYWRPDPDQLEALAAGGFIELIQYAPRMVMHSLTVWAATPEPGCRWLDCQRLDDHNHEGEQRSVWVNPGDRQAGKVVVSTDAQGMVTVTEAALAQLLTDAGWERAR